MRAKFINEQLDFNHVDNSSRLEINVNLPIEDKFRMFDFEIPEEREGPIIYKGETIGAKYSGSLMLYPDFVLDNFNLIKNIIDLAKAPFWYVNSREPKFNNKNES